MSTKAELIRAAFAGVATLRAAAEAHPPLAQALLAVKTLQARRFAGSYAAELSGGRFEQASRFFLTELYSAQDYSQRDAQFTRIAGAIEKLFPARVSALACELAQLHALTEDLDHAMARAWLAAGTRAPTSDQALARRYVAAWRTVGCRAERERQLRTVLAIGTDLAELVAKPGLRRLLRMMRAPARGAGLGDLQRFLETGFDTFAALARVSGGTPAFLGQIAACEQALIALLFDADAVACETQLAQTLGLAP